MDLFNSDYTKILSSNLWELFSYNTSEIEDKYINTLVLNCQKNSAYCLLLDYIITLEVKKIRNNWRINVWWIKDR